MPDSVLNIGDVALRYRFDGPADAPVLVLSNSLGTDLTMWYPQIPSFARTFRVLRYDTRGHGQSGVGRERCTIERLGGDVLALLDALGIERAHFCGLSMGGATGMWLGVHAPDRIARLALCNTAARIGAVRAGGMGAIIEAVIDVWFTRGFAQRDPAAIARIRSQLERCPPDGY